MGLTKSEVRCSTEIRIVHRPIDEIEKDPETHRSYMRTSCGLCGKFIGDKPLDIVR